VPSGTPDAVIAQTGTGKKKKKNRRINKHISVFEIVFSVFEPPSKIFSYEYTFFPGKGDSAAEILLLSRDMVH
jgi:hypothetical protein